MAANTVAQLVEEKEFPFTLNEFRFLSALVYDRAGIVLKDHKMNMVYSRLARRLRELGLETFSDYCALLKNDPGGAEIGVLINAITTNLTRFFREPHHFDHLARTVVPEMEENARRTGRNRLRIWSAGCSSGEEPYTIAMVLSGHFPRLANWNAKILATDLDTTMVAKGQRGVYPAKDMEGMPHGYHKRFFSAGADKSSATADDALKNLIAFKQLNLLGSWPMKGPFDAIFCRNVMIYFDEPTKARLIRRFAAMLRPGGWLYIGHSETMQDGADAFEFQGRTIYRRRG